MPIFRIGDKLHYFAHVPKCGGTSIESYLTQRFGRLALHEPGWQLLNAPTRWNRSSAEHIPCASLERIIPADWLASSFAVVRHPVRRLASAFFFSRDTVPVIPLTTDINVWFKEVASRIKTEPFIYGSHLAPQVSFIPAESRIFRCEEGLDQIIPYLDGLAGNSDGPRNMPERNVGRWRNEHAEQVLSQETLDLIGQVYASDFDQFGYDLPSQVSGIVLGDLPASSATGRPPSVPKRPLLNRIYRKLLIKANMG